MKFRWRNTKINIILKYYLCLCQRARENSFDYLCKYLLVMEFRFDAIVCSNLGNETFGCGHIKCSRGATVSPPLDPWSTEGGDVRSKTKNCRQF